MENEKILTLSHLVELEAQVILTKKYGRLKEMVSSEGGLGRLTALRQHQFWSKVDIRNEGDCWLWTACRLPKSPHRTHDYGWCNMMGRPMHAHRMSFLLTHGSINESLDVCHTCDNPPCVNPNHLFLGTARYNTQDCMSKNRFYYAPIIRGSSHYLTHLTEQDVLDIRQLYEAGMMQKDIGTQFNLSPGGIGRIVRREIWTHI